MCDSVSNGKNLCRTKIIQPFESTFAVTMGVLCFILSALWTFITVYIFAAADPNLPEQEYNALFDIYQSTNGGNWTVSNWSFSANANPCVEAWVGVTCILPDPFDTYHVSSLNLPDNLLRGTIPPSIGNLSLMTSVNFQQNSLSGELPPELLWLTNVISINLNNNLLKGTMPENPLTNSHNVLQVLILANNRFTGTISNSVITQFNNLRVFNINGNEFNGFLPAELLWMPTLQFLSCVSIPWSSPLPQPPAGWNVSLNVLQYLVLENCRMTGTLPLELNHLLHLRVLRLDNNQLSGDNSKLPTSLQVVSILYNKFNGRLNQMPFLTSGNLAVFQADYTCLHGTIPEGICNNRELAVLSMVQMNRHWSCSYVWFQNSAYISHRALEGTVPSCILDLPTIHVVDLSYNQLTGSISSNSPRLMLSPGSTLSLYNNMLSGPVPHYLNRFDFLYFDHNRFSGGLMYSNATSYPFETSYRHYTVHHNRLSGRLPASILYSPAPVGDTGYIMTGNFFSCNWDESDVPAGATNFQCGTNELEKTLTAWIVSAVTVLLVGCTCYVFKDKLRKFVDVNAAIYFANKWYSAASAVGSPDLNMCSTSQVWNISRTVCTAANVCSALCVLVLAPVYAILTANFGTYTYQYAWSVASVMLSGAISFSIQISLFVLVLCVGGYMLSKYKSMPASRALISPTPSPLRVYAVCLLYVAINMTVVGTVNVVFIGTVLYAPDIKYQIAISTFKIGWGVLCMPYLSRWVVYELSASRNDFFALELFVSLVNNIALPFFAVMVVSTECFFDLYRGALDVYTGYRGDPNPYYYSYQCAYTFFNYYVVAFVYVCLFTTFGLPLLECCLMWLHSRAKMDSIWYKLLNRALPRALRPVEADPALILAHNVFKPYFDSTQYLVSQYTFLALILTFGVVFPPLALCLAVTMLATTAYAMLKVGRLLSNAAQVQQQRKYAELLEQESRGVLTSAGLQHRAAWMLFACSCWFMTLFLFDTLGDAHGFKKAYWVLIVVPSLPVVLYGSFAVWKMLTKAKNEDDNNAKREFYKEEGGLEMNGQYIISPMANTKPDDVTV